MIYQIWNVRGLDRGNKDSDTREVVAKHKVDMLVLNETKLKDVDIFRAQSIQGNSPCIFLYTKATENASGGVIVIWNPNVFVCSSSYQGERWIMMNGQLLGTQWDCSIILIYGGNSVEVRTKKYEKYIE